MIVVGSNSTKLILYIVTERVANAMTITAFSLLKLGGGFLLEIQQHL